jgi:hypothetical protein
MPSSSGVVAACWLRLLPSRCRQSIRRACCASHGGGRAGNSRRRAAPRKGRARRRRPSATTISPSKLAAANPAAAAERVVASPRAQPGHADGGATAQRRGQVLGSSSHGHVLGPALPATVATSARGSTATFRIPARSMTRTRRAGRAPPSRVHRSAARAACRGVERRAPLPARGRVVYRTRRSLGVCTRR